MPENSGTTNTLWKSKIDLGTGKIKAGKLVVKIKPGAGRWGSYYSVSIKFQLY